MLAEDVDLLTIRLEQPALVAAPEKLPSRWRHTVLEVDCARPRGLEEGPWLPAAIRGALGHALAAAEPRLALPGRVRPTARTILFDIHGHVTGRLSVPPPWVPEVELEGDIMRVRIVLFGFADYWRDEVRRGLLAALAGGLAIRERGPLRVTITVLAGRWWRAESVAVPEPPERVRLLLATPLCLRAAGAVKADLDGLAIALLDRISGLARWQDHRLAADWRSWRELSTDLVFDRVELRPVGWTRRSSRQPGRAIPMHGFLGGFDIVHPPGALMPLLALGALAHVGAHTTLGLGRYRLLVYP